MAGILRWCWFVAGVLALSSTALLYEDEEKRLRNKLVDWWVNVSDVGERLIDRQMAAAQAIAAIAYKAFTAVLGGKLISWRSVWVCMCLMNATLILPDVLSDLANIHERYVPMLPKWHRHPLLADLPQLAIWIAAALLPYLLSKQHPQHRARITAIVGGLVAAELGFATYAYVTVVDELIAELRARAKITESHSVS